MADPKQASNPPQLLAHIGGRLDEVGARWNTIGALAVAYHGLVRASLDADALVTFKGSRVNAEQFAAQLREEKLQVEYRPGDAGDPIGFVLRIRDGQGNCVDLLGGIRKVDPEFFERGITDEPEGMKLRFASAEDLIALKLFAGGPKDIEDAAGVLAANRSTIDKELLSNICHRFGRATQERCRRLLGG